MAGEYGGMAPGQGFPGAFGMPGPPGGGFLPAGPDTYGEDMAHWGPQNGGMMPPGNLMPGRSHPIMMEGRGRGGFGRGPESMHGRGGYSGRFGRGGLPQPPQDEFEGPPGGWNQQGMGDSYRSRMPDRGRGGRGGPPGGRWGGRSAGWHGHGRAQEASEGRQPGADAAAAERRRASAAARLRAQVSQLQVSRELLGGDAATAEAYARIMEGGEGEAPEAPDARRLFTHPLFAVDEAPPAAAAAAEPEPESDPHAAFEECLRLYQQAQAGCAVLQSEHGNFLLPAR